MTKQMDLDRVLAAVEAVKGAPLTSITARELEFNEDKALKKMEEFIKMNVERIISKRERNRPLTRQETETLKELLQAQESKMRRACRILAERGLVDEWITTRETEIQTGTMGPGPKKVLLTI